MGHGFYDRSEPWVAYEWLVVMGALASFYTAWGIGANDVANSFATSVGSKTLQLWQACIIASVFEFVGAVSLGGEVVRTVAGAIADPSYFQDFPEMFAFGMLCAMLVAGTWLLIATYLSLAVSTTHSIVGAVLGFSLCYGGIDAVTWSEPTDTFPYRKGFITIIMSWFISPIMSGLMACAIFALNRLLVLRRKNSVSLAFASLPLLVFVTVYINIFFVLFKGARAELGWGENKCAWVAALVALGLALVMVPVTFWLRRRHQREHDTLEAAASAAAADPEAYAKQMEAEAAERAARRAQAQAEASSSVWGRIKAQSIKGLTTDVHEDVHTNEKVNLMHMNVEIFDPRTEGVYKYLQVFSACCVSFAHGANDVANAVGPFTGIWYVYNNYAVSSSADMPRWILVLGAAGIVTGLATYGYNIIKVLGVALATMTPSRGFSAELATGLTISLASVYGIPVSTTQIIVGAEMGVGITDNLRTGANYPLFLKTFLGWIFTIVFSAATTAALFAFCTYSPSQIMADYISDYQLYLTVHANGQISFLNATNLANNRTLQRFDARLHLNLTHLGATLATVTDAKRSGHVDRRDLLEIHRNVTWLYASHSTPTVGFNRLAAFNTSANITVPA